MKLRDYVYGDDGAPISGATVEVYSYGGQTPVASTTSGTDGAWTIDGLPGGEYRVRYSWGGQERWLESRVWLQLTQVVGPDGTTAPLASQSVTAAMLVDGAVGSKTETVNPDLAGGANIATIASHLSWLARQVRGALGTANWYDAVTFGGLSQRGLVASQAITTTQTVTASEEVTVITGPQLGDGEYLLIATVVLEHAEAGKTATARLLLGPTPQLELPLVSPGARQAAPLLAAVTGSGQVTLRVANTADASLSVLAPTNLIVVRTR